MGQSIAQNYLHLVFPTKNREPLLLIEYEQDLYKYLAGICKKLDCPALKIGGYKDHVHILCRLSKNISVSDLARKLKGNSSKWIKSKSTKWSNFYWSNGYGAFSVSHSHVHILENYIENQHSHHQKLSFKDEYLRLLQKYKVEYKEEFLWDT